MTSASSPSLPLRIFRRMMTLIVTLLVVAGAASAVFVGGQFLAARAEAKEQPAAAQLVPVHVRRLAQEDGYTLSRRFIGQVEAGTELRVAFERSGKLQTLLVQEGDSVTKGQVIAELDTALLMAEANRLAASHAATAAQLDFAERRLSRAEALLTQGFASQERVDQALSNRDELANRLAEIVAGQSSNAINLDKSRLLAPFDGRVAAQSLDGGEALSPGQQVMTLVETARPLVRVGLPVDLDPKIIQTARITLDGQTHTATLIRQRPDIDPVTRTRTALFALNDDATPLFGQTATLELSTFVVQAGLWVPMDALREGQGGQWTILVVEGTTVRTAAVELLHAETSRAFVRGTFSDGVQMIRSGAHRVVPGQQVQIMEAQG